MTRPRPLIHRPGCPQPECVPARIGELEAVSLPSLPEGQHRPPARLERLDPLTHGTVQISTPQPPEKEHHMSTHPTTAGSGCSVAGCDRPHDARGFCPRHYAAWYRASGKVKERERSCVMEGCDRPHMAHGWCEMHYKRWRKWGDPAIAQRPLDPQAPPPTYDAMHQRVRRARGRPPAHACVDCGSPAEQWSYDHTDPDELRGPTNGGRWTSECAYSLDVDRYQPRCRPCHMQFDRGVPPNHCNRGHEFTPENTYTNPHGKRTCRTCMATRYQEHKAEQRARQREYRARRVA